MEGTWPPPLVQCVEETAVKSRSVEMYVVAGFRCVVFLGPPFSVDGGFSRALCQVLRLCEGNA